METRMSIIPNSYWALNFEYDSFIALTNYTDVLVLLLRLCPMFLRVKLNNLYIRLEQGQLHGTYLSMNLKTSLERNNAEAYWKLI